MQLSHLIKGRWLFALALAVPLASCGSSSEEPPTGPGIFGQIVETRGGIAVSGSEAIVYSSGSSEAIESDRSNKQGEFSFPGLEPGRYDLKVRKDGWAGTDWYHIDLAPEEHLRLEVIQAKAFDPNAATEPPILEVQLAGSSPEGIPSFYDTLPFQAKVSADSSYTAPIRSIEVMGGLSLATLTRIRSFFDMEDTGEQILESGALSGLGSAAGELIYLTFEGSDLNRNRSVLLVPISFSRAAVEAPAKAPSTVDAVAITTADPLVLGVAGRSQTTPQAAPAGSSLRALVRWCPAELATWPARYLIWRSEDGGPFVLAGSVAGDDLSGLEPGTEICPEDPFDWLYAFSDTSGALKADVEYTYRVDAEGSDGSIAAGPISSTTPLGVFVPELELPNNEVANLGLEPVFEFSHPQKKIKADGAAYILAVQDNLISSAAAFWVTMGGEPFFVAEPTKANGLSKPLIFTKRDGKPVELAGPSLRGGTVSVPYNFDQSAGLETLQALRPYAWRFYSAYAYRLEPASGRVMAYSVFTSRSDVEPYVNQSTTQIYDFTTGAGDE